MEKFGDKYIFGLSESKKEAALKKIEVESKEEVENLDLFECGEKEEKIIGDAIFAVIELIKEFKGEPKEISRKNIYIVKRDQDKDSYFSPSSGNIIIQRYSSDKEFVESLIHEILHSSSFLSFNARTITREFEKVVVRRSGWVIRNKLIKEFGYLNEAITADLTEYCVNKYFKSKSLFEKEDTISKQVKDRIIELIGGVEGIEEYAQKELARIGFIKNPELVNESLNKAANEKEFNNGSNLQKLKLLLSSIEGKCDARVYDQEIIQFHLLLDELSKFPETGSKENLRRMFFKAYFDGNVMPIARIVEKNLGRGSFRALAKEDFSVLSKKE